MIGRRDGDGRDDRAMMNPPSHVGDLTCAPNGRPASRPAVLHVRHSSEDSMIAGRAHRGAWRRPHAHRTPGQVVALVLWWFVMAAFVAASIVIGFEQP
jgi:hypothetical protein